MIPLKKAEGLKAERNNFIYGNKDLNIKGCVANGIDEKIANKIFDELAQFARYAFNKSHAAAYATVAYQTAYLKYYYRSEFFTSICNSVIFNRDKLAEYVGSVIMSGIKILPVDINKSFEDYTVEGNDIRMGFAALKKVGANISRSIIEERDKNGEYKSFIDAVVRMSDNGCNKVAFEALIKCGAFDSFIGNRNQKLHMYPDIIDTRSKKVKHSMEGEISIFDLMEEQGIDTGNNESDEEMLKDYDNIEDFSDEEKLITEKEYTGIYLSGHPLQKYISFIEKNVNAKSTNFIKDDDGEIEIEDGSRVTIVGVIDEVNIMKVKRTGDEMAKLVLSDMNGSFEVLAFHNKYEEYKSIIEKNRTVFIDGKINVDTRNDRGTIYIDKMFDIDEYILIKEREKMPATVRIKIHFKDMDSFIKSHVELYAILKSNSGRDYVQVIVDKERQMKILKEIPITLTDNLVNALRDEYGIVNVEVVDDK